MWQRGSVQAIADRQLDLVVRHEGVGSERADGRRARSERGYAAQRISDCKSDDVIDLCRHKRRVFAMSFQLVQKPEWQTLFDAISKTLEGKFAEIEVMGLDLGDQLEVEWLPINGITYDPKDEALYIYIQAADRNLDHMIASPREVYIEFGSAGLSHVVVIDPYDHKQIVRFRAPLELPPRREHELPSTGQRPVESSNR
jgi:uncharacterized protein YuzE